MNLDEIKKMIEGQTATVEEAGDIKNYFILLGYDYPFFSLHMDVSPWQLASMLFRASLNSGILRMAILATAAVIKAKQEGGVE